MSKRKSAYILACHRSGHGYAGGCGHYHGFSKSATIVNLIKKEFWRIFPAGTNLVPPDTGARIEEEVADGTNS